MNRKRLLTAFSVVALLGGGVLAVYAAEGFNQAKPFIYDPAKTRLVQGTWLEGIGCPTGAKVADYPATTQTRTFTAGGCTTGDPSDRANQGLLLVKTGPTNNNASAGAVLKNVKGITLTELGYDLRKPGADQNDARGSHCGAGAARFNVTTSDGFWAVGCNSPAPTVTASGDGWMRLRWAPIGYKDNTVLSPITGTVKSISIVFDEGQDVGPDNFGVAIIDNIDVNGALVGSGKAGEHNDSKDKEGDSNDD